MARKRVEVNIFDGSVAAGGQGGGLAKNPEETVFIPSHAIRSGAICFSAGGRGIA